MRYTFYYDDTGAVQVGLYYEDGVVPVADILSGELSSKVSCDNIMKLEKPVMDELNRVYHEIESGKLEAEKKVVKFAPLVLNEKANVFCVGRNYKSVMKDMNKASEKDMSSMELPAFFYKPNRSVVATGDNILSCVTDTARLDYEGEIGVVIGKMGKDIPVEEAEEYIYGFTVCNDVSDRDVMKAYYQMYKGKSMDSFAPIGPCITTVGDVSDFRNMNIETRVNGERRQKGNTSELYFDFPTVVSCLSRAMTLMPGDIIMTGTPAGIGAAMNPPRFLKEGDVVEITVEGVGTLTNTVHEYTR